MAVSAITITQNTYPGGLDNGQRMFRIYGTFAVTTGTYPPGGYALNWGALEGVKAIPAFNTGGTNTSLMPIDVDVKSAGYRVTTAGTGPSGYVYLWDNVQGNLHVFVSNNGVSNASGPLIELGGNVPGSVVNDVIVFEAVFVRNA